MAIIYSPFHKLHFINFKVDNGKESKEVNACKKQAEWNMQQMSPGIGDSSQYCPDHSDDHQAIPPARVLPVAHSGTPRTDATSPIKNREKGVCFLPSQHLSFLPSQHPSFLSPLRQQICPTLPFLKKSAIIFLCFTNDLPVQISITVKWDTWMAQIFFTKGSALDGKATQFPRLSPQQKAHTTTITVGTCFPEPLNEDGCSDKGCLVFLVS
jgi:hypothetical protein